MELSIFKPGKIPIDIHGQVCDFLYDNHEDLQRHLQYSDRTTFFVFSKDDKIVGTVYCVWKIDDAPLPIEEVFTQDKKRMEIPRSAVEVGGLKLELSTEDRIKLLPRIYHLLLEETKGRDVYITCTKEIESLYRRKFLFSTVGPVTFNYIEWFVAMHRGPDVVAN